MLLDTQRFQESFERAKSLNLDNVIETLGSHEKQREGRRQAVEHRRKTLLTQVQDPLAAQVRLERILQGNELTDITYLAQGLVCARSVCRIAIHKNGRLIGYGTGFLVAPGILMTNEHVLTSVDEVKGSIAQFRYERDLQGADLSPIEFSLKATPPPIIFKELDFALVAVEPRSAHDEPLDQFAWLRLNATPNKALIGEYLTIIQHPNGERKQICVRENKLLRYSENGPYLWYQTDTAGGSSGSPVFNNSWEVVAIHHSGVPRTKKVRGKDLWLNKDGQVWNSSMGVDAIEWIANEGVRISRIADYLNAEHRGHPIAELVTNTSGPVPGEIISGRVPYSDQGGGIQIQKHPNGRTRILVPVDIDVNVNTRALSEASRDVQPAPAIKTVASTPVTEKVVIEPNYSKRNGYNPKFLGAGAIVPLPKVKGGSFGTALRVGRTTEIKYWNYSVVLNGSRRLAFFSAANVDASRFRGNRDAQGDTWYKDGRIGDDFQIGAEFYKKQKTFEADRTFNPFDQGHLTRRSDLQWGSDDDEAKRNGDDSYHYTNCSPQHWQFNQNNRASGLWFRLEELAIESVGGRGKLCLINGPVFDAPPCFEGPDGGLRLDLRGRSVKDGKFGDVQIPKQFFKVIAYRADDVLRARAFVVTQEDLLATVDRYYPEEKKRVVLTDEEVRLYQVRIPDLERLTGLDFGSLSKYDDLGKQESVFVEEGRPLEDERSVHF